MTCKQAALLANQTIADNGTDCQPIQVLSIPQSALVAAKSSPQKEQFYFSLKIDRKYPPDPSLRGRNSDKELNQAYGLVDQAIVSLVKILNETFGIKTSASCEGHFKADPQKAPAGSYIMADVFPFLDLKWGHFLEKKGFSTKIIHRIAGLDNIACYYKDLPEGGSLLCEFGEFGGKNRMILRVMTRRETSSPQQDIFRAKLSQSSWDQFRDDGWDLWLGLLGDFYQQEKIEFVLEVKG